jgi:hypothetical protein
MVVETYYKKKEGKEGRKRGEEKGKKEKGEEGKKRRDDYHH